MGSGFSCIGRSMCVSCFRIRYTEFKTYNAEVVGSEELWFGKPPNVSQFGERDEAPAAVARERQAIAYSELESMVHAVEDVLPQSAHWQASGFGPVGRQICLALLMVLKHANPSGGVGHHQNLRSPR